MNVIESLGEWSAITSSTAIGEAAKQRKPVKILVASDDQNLILEKCFKKKAQVFACKNKSRDSHGFHRFQHGFFLAPIAALFPLNLGKLH